MQNVTETPRGSNPHLTLQEKLARFPDGIPLILPYGSKGQPVPNSPLNRYMKGWEKRTLTDIKKADYETDLRTLQCNVAIRQGGGLTRYVSFDFDTDDASVWEEFFLANPRLRDSFRTKGARGFNVWILIKGDYPATKKEIEVRGQKVEWRGNGYVLIHGRHPSGVDYTVLHDAPIVEMAWAELVCPGPEWKNWPRAYEKEKAKGEHETGSLVKLSPWQIKRRQQYVEREYEVLSWNEDFSKAQVECKNKEAHSTDTGDGQSIVFTGADSKGLVSYYCSHAHCHGDDPVTKTSFNKEETRELIAGFMSAETFVLHQQTEKFNETVKDLYEHMGTIGCFYRRSEGLPFGIWHWKPGMAEPMTLSQSTLTLELGEEKILFSKFNAKGNLNNCLPSKEISKSILDAGYPVALPIASSMTKRALLVKTEEGAKMIGNSYSPELKTIILGKVEDLPEISFEEARKWIDELMNYWIWKEPADRSRALAELLTPALLHGGFISRPIPAMLCMADNHEAGKTFWQTTVANIYGHSSDPHSYGKTTIGGIEEQLNLALERGEPFFFIDELDGTIKSTFINAFITGGDEKMVRTPYGRYVNVPTDKMMVMLAGVKDFVLDPQLASRVIPIRIIKPVSNADWMTPDGELLGSWIERHNKELLASVYAIISQWDKQALAMEAPDSRFPSWSMATNSILKMLAMPRAGLELREIQDDISNPAADWMTEMVRIMIAEGLLWTGEGKGTLINTAGIRSLCAGEGWFVPVTNTSLRDRDLVFAQQRALGNNLNRLPKAGRRDNNEPIYRIGSYYLIRHQGRRKKNGKENFYYLLSSKMDFPAQYEEHVHVETLGAED